MGAPSEEKLICDQFNLEALTVNQLKVSKFWQTGKMFSLEPKREVANRCHKGNNKITELRTILQRESPNS